MMKVEEPLYRMDSHKLLWHLDRVLAWQNGESIAPLHIDLGITTGCNMKCNYCYGAIQGHDGLERYDMPEEALLGFLGDAKAEGVRSIAFIGEGENTLNSVLPNALMHCRRIALDASLATNGLNLRREWVEPLLASSEWIRFNVSAANPEVYARIHGVDPRAARIVFGNIAVCVEEKRRRGFACTLGLQMILMRENISEILPLAKLGKELGVDYLVIKQCSDSFDTRLNAPMETYPEIQETLQSAESLSDSSYKVSIKWSKLLNRGKKVYGSCLGTPFLLAISGNGNVFPCGHFFNIRKDEFLLGNIVRESFRDILSRPRYRQVHERIASLDVNKDCYMNCRLHYINEFLWELKHPPKHRNFI